ncbi:hypothetical protein Q8W16_06690, partial [Photobacterium damselae subsp. piscicida]|nr:hypothetical protein [Photobacterium damselae subsp. piscicida]
MAKLYHNGADLERPRIEERVSYVNKIAKAIQNKIKDKRSQRTYASFSYYFIRYVQFCDKNALNPFTEEGFLAYVGDNGELRRLVALNNERPPIRFDIPDGTELG